MSTKILNILHNNQNKIDRNTKKKRGKMRYKEYLKSKNS